MNRFEIGQWMECEDGYGQILYIRDLFVESFSIDQGEKRIGDFLRTIFICKILCDFDGKIKKRKRINSYTSINPIKKINLEQVKKIKKNEKEYYDYIHYEDKIDICRQIFLVYKTDASNKEELKSQIAEINNRLQPAFTFKEFVKECKKSNFPFKVEDFVRYGQAYGKSIIRLRLDSFLYKTKGAESIFHNIVLFDF